MILLDARAVWRCLHYKQQDLQLFVLSWWYNDQNTLIYIWKDFSAIKTLTSVSLKEYFSFIFHFQWLIVLVCRKLTYHKMVNLIGAKLEIYQYLFPLASTCIWTMCICIYTHVHMYLHPCAHVVSYTCVPTHRNMWMHTWKIPRHTYRTVHQFNRRNENKISETKFWLFEKVEHMDKTLIKVRK